MSTSSSIPIPPELSDHTIDFLHDDISSLRACALTCKAWLPASRYHLFAAVSVNDAKHLDRLISLLSPPSGHSPDVVSYIRTLSLSKPLPTHATSSPSTPWENAVPSKLSPRLPYLDTLHIQSFLSFWQSSSFSLASYSQFSTVRSVHLANTSLKSFQELRSLLGRLPKVDDLWLDNVTFGNEQTFSETMLGIDLEERTYGLLSGLTPPSSGATTPRGLMTSDPACDLVSLTSLRVDANPKPIATLLGWLLLTPSVQTLRTVTFSALEAHDLDATSTFLGIVGENLERLTLGFKEGATGAELQPSFMSRLSLRSLTFTSLSRTSPSANSWVVPFLTRFISNAANLIPLQCLAFNFSNGASDQSSDVLDPLNLSSLAAQLKRSAYISRVIFNGLPLHGSTERVLIWKNITSALDSWSGQVLFN